MSAEPIMIYSHRVDPVGVVGLLRRMAPDGEVQGPPQDWRRITIRGRARLLRKPPTLSFGHDPAYYAGGDFGAQMAGMQAYFSRFPRSPPTAGVMALIRSFRFALTLFPAPEPDLYVDSDDPRLQYVFAVARHLDGVLFLPSGLRDAAGRLLYGAGPPDPRAVMPAVPVEEPASRGDAAADDEAGEGTFADEDESDAPPPTRARVARRACALAAVCARALLEQDDHRDPDVERTHQDLLAWVEAIGVEDELEPDERTYLQEPLGAPSARDTLNATWRLEGLVVLAWALRRFDLPPHDELVAASDLLRSLGLLDAAAARELLATAALRPADEVDALRNRLLALHWRLTGWRVNLAPLDFADFARHAWFGPLDLTGVPLAESDLALAGTPLCRALRTPSPRPPARRSNATAQPTG